MTLHELHERLLAWATAEPRQAELLAARRSYFDRFGEPHEEERTFETRMNGMLDYYLYDHRPAGGPRTNLELFLGEESGRLAAEDTARFAALAGNIHGLFEVRKIVPHQSLRLRDVFTSEDRDITERRQLAGLAKGDLLEARLLPYDGQLFFSGAFLFHPREVRKIVLAEVKKRKKEARGGPLDVKGFLAQISRMAHKLERYRNVRVESLYDFARPAMAATPVPTRGEPG
jgi:hypothetical protein